MFESINTWIIIAYFLGAIPFSLLIGLAKGTDIRNHGSGNVGATNCGRVLGKKYGILCFILDLTKGFLPVFLAGKYCNLIGNTSLQTTQAWAWLCVGILAVIGHVFPIWLKFKGGKGVATSAGMLLGFYPILTFPCLALLLLWIALTLKYKMISLSSIIVAGLLPVFLLAYLKWIKPQGQADQPFLIMSLLIAALVIYMHRSNIKRICAGTESKIGQKK